MGKLYLLLLSVIFLGCENSRLPFEYIETQLHRFEEIEARERNLRMPMSGSIEINLLDHYLVKRNEENLNIQLPLLITVDFTFRTARDFTFTFSNGLDGNPFTVNGTDSTMTVVNNDGNIFDIPVDVMKNTTDGYVANEMSTEVGFYLWGIECILIHIFPLTNGWKVYQDILDEKKQSDYVIVSSNERSGIDYLEMTFAYNNLKHRYETQLFDINPVLYLRSITGAEKINVTSYHDYAIWNEDKDWLFPKIVHEFEKERHHSSILISVSLPNVHE